MHQLQFVLYRPTINIHHQATFLCSVCVHVAVVAPSAATVEGQLQSGSGRQNGTEAKASVTSSTVGAVQPTPLPTTPAPPLPPLLPSSPPTAKAVDKKVSYCPSRTSTKEAPCQLSSSRNCRLCCCCCWICWLSLQRASARHRTLAV